VGEGLKMYKFFGAILHMYVHRTLVWNYLPIVYVCMYVCMYVGKRLRKHSRQITSYVHTYETYIFHASFSQHVLTMNYAC
jgi:hypothetical protein